MPVIQVYVSEEEVGLVDRVRGEESRGRWVAGLVRREIEGEDERWGEVERRLSRLEEMAGL